MKKVAVLALAIPLIHLFFASDTFAQVFHQYPDATVIKAGEFVTGPYIAVGEYETFRLGGLARMNATEYFDVGFELLADVSEGNWRYGGGADVKLSVLPTGNTFPFDLSVTAGLGAIVNDEYRLLQFPFGGVISSPYKLDRGNMLVPYLGVYLLVVDTKITRAGLPDASDTDLDVELRGGIRYTLTAGPDIFAAVHLGRQDLIMIGMSFWPKGRD